MDGFIDETMSLADPYQIAAMASRFEPVIRKLDAFSFASVVGAIAGLLTRPENHVATTRLEAMAHLAALGCRGDVAPSMGRLREWINGPIRNDIITSLEDPVEDVVVSNVVTPVGNVRLFEGNSADVGYSVQDCLAALSDLSASPWAGITLKQIVALLRLSERVAVRSKLPRYTMASNLPRQPVAISAAIIKRGRKCVTFTEEDLNVLEITLDDLEPFVFGDEDGQKLVTEHLKHSSFQRRPLIRADDQLIVGLPTAIGAAVVRYTIECALHADDIDALQWAVTKEQVARMWTLGARAWEVDDIELPPRPPSQPVFLDSIGRFDRDSPVHLLYVPDCMASVAADGLHTWHRIERAVTNRIERIWTELSTNPGYRGGLTIVVHGGVGRGFHLEVRKGPNDWHILALPIADFMLLAWDQELSALRAWKILDQEYHLGKRGVLIQNLSGFPNLYAALRNEGFTIIPEDCDLDLDVLSLPTDSVASLRQFLRTRLDSHAVVAPGGSGWLQVQRMTTQRNHSGDKLPPIYISAGHAAASDLASCVESSTHIWWMISTDLPDAPEHRNLVYMVWQMALNWLVPVASVLEERLLVSPSRTAVYQLRFPGIAGFSTQAANPGDSVSPPLVRLHQGRISIDCQPEYLRALAEEHNVGERMMVAAMLRGAHLWARSPMPSPEEVDATVQAVVGSSDARFFAMTPSRTPEESIYATAPLPDPLFPSPEDRAWSRIGLAQLAGWDGPSGPIPNSSAEPLMGRAVASLWKRIRTRLLGLDRRSILQRSLLNAAAVQKDRLEWQRFSPAMLAMSDDEAELRESADLREADRALAALASRVVAEMALCTSPIDDGKACTERDLDYLVAETASLLACAVQKDAMHYDLLNCGVMVHPNGSFGFDPAIRDIVYPYVSALRGRQFWDVRDDGAAPESTMNGARAQARFDRAFIAEFGLSVAQYLRFVEDVAESLVQRRAAYTWVPRIDVVRMLERVGSKDPAATFAALVLVPRDKWDDENPGSGCESRDWYPWRYGRRLSVLRRPFVQLALGRGSDVLLMPTLLEAAARYLLEARSGRVPDRLFDSDEMRSWIGAVTDQLGHAFNETVAARLRDLGWKTRVEVRLTELGGVSELGDIDVLAWRDVTGPVYAIECKRLMHDRTVGEIGRRLRDYTEARVDGKRTAMQKHVDRLAFLANDVGTLVQITGLPVAGMSLRSALVTDDITPMQFSRQVQEILDVVVDYGSVGDLFGTDE